ncbi:hypothetical protein [Streptomyces liangshanensis]
MTLTHHETAEETVRDDTGHELLGRLVGPGQRPHQEAHVVRDE